MFRNAKSRRTKAASGATLVEVAITVGIIVTMMIPLIGMLSLALDTSRKAVSDSIAARISSHLASSLQQANWDNIDAWSGKNYFYDDHGENITENQTQESSYVARVRMEAVDSGVALSTNSKALPNKTSRRIQVLVASRPSASGVSDLDEAENALNTHDRLPRHVHISRIYLVNMEKISL